MGFNYGYSRKKMEKEFAEIAVICAEDGMPEKNIEAIHRLMLDILNNDRRFYVHTLSYDGLEDEDGNGMDNARLLLFSKFIERFSVHQSEICKWGRLAWIDDIDTPEIIIWLKSLNEDDIFMLTLLVVDGMRQREIAQVLEKHDSAISRKMKHLRKSLTKVLPEQLKKQYRI